MCGKVVAYYRVSTAKQGKSGLGLEAQRAAVEAFVQGRSGRIVAEFVEVESGKENARPELLKALRTAKVSGARLVIAKLDRLSRNAAFLLTLRDSGVSFVAADMPEACDLTVGVLALVAEQERRAISARTKAALAAAKARGKQLGNLPTLVPGAGRERASAAARAKAAGKAQELRQVVEALRAEGFASAKGIARELTRRGIETPRGKASWTATQVGRLLGVIAR
jgi:DNA invertase Pin-like site-specific DNA recombinase